MEKLEKGILLYAIEKKLPTKKTIQTLVRPKPGGGPPVRLAFNMQRQTQTNWCWAATATSISLFYNASSGWTQCSVAASTLKNTCCVVAGPCNVPYYLDDALTVTKNFVSFARVMQFNEVEAQLSIGRMVACRIDWGGDKGHFIAIYGCRNVEGTNYFEIDDPDTGKSLVTETGLLSSYSGSGSWSHTFITQP